MAQRYLLGLKTEKSVILNVNPKSITMSQHGLKSVVSNRVIAITRKSVLSNHLGVNLTT